MVESFVKDLWVSLLSAGHTTGGPSGVVVGSGGAAALGSLLLTGPAISIQTSDVGIFSFGFYHVARSFVSRA